MSESTIFSSRTEHATQLAQQLSSWVAAIDTGSLRAFNVYVHPCLADLLSLAFTIVEQDDAGPVAYCNAVGDRFWFHSDPGLAPDCIGVAHRHPIHPYGIMARRKSYHYLLPSALPPAAVDAYICFRSNGMDWPDAQVAAESCR